jgi:hypothetical protein
MAKTRGTGLQAVAAARGRLGRAKLADQRLRPKLPNQDPSDRNDTGVGSFSANGPGRYLGGGGGGIQRPVQYRLHPVLPHRSSCLGARRYVIIDSYPKYLTLYPVRQCDGLGKPGMGQGAGLQPLVEPGPPRHAARCRITRGLSPSVPQITQCFHNNTLFQTGKIWTGAVIDSKNESHFEDHWVM